MIGTTGSGVGAPPMVSVIIPCYNQARFLAEAIESALAQTHPGVEVVVVDDGSTDDTAAVAARYDGVRIVRQENQGLSSARNAGLRHSRGEYLVFLDADDRLLANAIEAGLPRIVAVPSAALVYGGFRWIDDRGRVLGVHGHQHVGGDPYAWLLYGNHIGMNGAVVYRRRCLEDVGGFDPTLRACEDYDVYLKLARRHEVLSHSEVVAEYRQHDANMSADKQLIASSAIRILGRQWRFIPLRGSRRRAYMDGIGYWLEAYGGANLWPASRWQLRGGGRTRLRAWGMLVRHVPLFMVGQLVRSIYRWPGRLAERIRLRPGRRDAPTPVVGDVRFGDLRRLRPIDRYFGFQRGTPIDRYYIERFFETHGAVVRGRVLEARDNAYARRFGGPELTAIDILDTDQNNPVATLIADLATPDALPEGRYDCVILAQALQLVYEVDSAIDNVFRALKPGGTLLLTVPGISKTNQSMPWYWSFTEPSVRRMLERRFPATHVQVEPHGNVLAACAFLQGLAAEELHPDELNSHDPEYALTILARAAKPTPDNPARGPAP